MRPEVNEVIHPALPGSRGHELWKRDFTGATSLFGIVLKPVAKARIDALLDGMRLFGTHGGACAVPQCAHALLP